MLHNAVRDSVQNREDHVYDNQYNIIEPATTDADTASMKQTQGDLRIMRNALSSALGHHKYSGRSEAFGDMIRRADPTGAKQRSGLRPDQVSDAYRDAIGDRYGIGDDDDF